MKKIVLMMAFVAVGFAAAAQSLNVQSAAQDMRRGYLNKAKAAIDKACVHDATKNDAKTWYYAGLIYTQIGGESTNPKSKFKDLDPEWLTNAKDAAFRCKELTPTRLSRCSPMWATSTSTRPSTPSVLRSGTTA